MNRLRPLSLLLLVWLCAACAPPRAAPVHESRSNANRITAAEVETARFPDALSLVQALRPRWLRERATSLTSGYERAQVYVDGIHLGDSEMLRQVAVPEIALMEYLDGSSATQRFGTNHGGGAILVTTRRR